MTETSSSARRGVPLWAQIVVWAVLAVLLVVVALGLRRSQQGTVVPGDTLPDFTINLFDGYTYQSQNQITLSQLRGKVVVINFWASWCKPCEEEAALLEAAWQSYKDGGKVIFIGADYVDTEPEARGYLAKFNITYPNGPDLATRVSQLFRIKGVPETYFIDANGVLRQSQIGPFTSEAEIHQIIDSILAAQ